jgi:uncharacterized membrane protein YedE/YeeE
MIRLLAALAAGLLFGAGLALSGMNDPAVVLGFLDIAGAWNPTLAFVMGGALAVTFPGYQLVLRRGRALLEPKLALPTARAIDVPLVGGAALFGIGWGLAGYCPGPALASLAGAQPGTIVFVTAMLIGMVAARLVRGQAAPAAPLPGRA